MSSNMPLGVKIIAILYMVGAVLTALLGILLMFASPIISTFLTAFAPNAAALVALGAAALVVMGIITVIIGIVGVFIGLALWRGKNWARIVVIVLAALGVISGLTSLPMGIGGAVINGVIVWYLAFYKPAVKAFD
jgi:hypothetical protein